MNTKVMEKKLRDKFDFLKQQYDFREVTNAVAKDYCIIKMQNNTTGISLNYERREDDIIVYLYRLIDGAMIDDKIPISADIPLNCIDLRYIVVFKKGESITDYDWKEGKFYDDLIQNIIYDLKNYAEDILKGNFEVFDKVDAIAKKRRLEWQNQ